MEKSHNTNGTLDFLDIFLFKSTTFNKVQLMLYFPCPRAPQTLRPLRITTESCPHSKNDK